MATSATPPSFSDQLRTKTRNSAAFFFIFMCLLFSFFYLPDSVLSYARERFTSLSSLLSAIGFVLGSGILGTVLGSLIAGHDPLATGKSASARFFQNQYPSRLIAQNYGCTPGEANDLWFTLFNPWETENPSKYVSYVLTRERGNACRRVFTARIALFAFALISGLTWLAGWLSGLDVSMPERTFTRTLFLLLALVAAGVLFALNRLTPSGCWWYWREINEINKAWLQSAVFTCAPTLADAQKLIGDPVWRKAHGYV